MNEHFKMKFLVVRRQLLTASNCECCAASQLGTKGGKSHEADKVAMKNCIRGNLLARLGVASAARGLWLEN